MTRPDCWALVAALALMLPGFGTTLVASSPQHAERKVAVAALPTRPEILGSARRVLAPGESTTLVAAPVSGTSYQWWHNNRPIPQATDSTLTLAAVTRATAGWYVLRATNTEGSVDSAAVFILVAPATTRLRAWGRNDYGQLETPADLNDVVATCAGFYQSLALRRDGTVSRWPESAVGVSPSGLTDIVAVAGGYYYDWIALRSDGTLVASTESTSGLTGVVSIKTCEGGMRVALKSDGTVVAWAPPSSSQPVVPPGLVDVVAIATGGNHALALRRDGTVVAWGLNNLGQATVPAGLQDVVSVHANDYSSYAVRADGGIVKWGWAADGRHDIPAVYPHVQLVAAGGFVAAVRPDGTVQVWGHPTTTPADLRNVYSLDGANGSLVALRDTGEDVAPVIVTAPTDRIAIAGQRVAFSVEASGSPPLSYQWQKDGVDIPGATDRGFALPAVTSDDAGAYRVTISNHIGSVASIPARLTVNPAIGSITPTVARRQVLAPGDTLSLSAAATGSGPLAFQWYHKGRPIEDATGSEYAKAGVTLADSGWYLLAVSDANGTRWSVPFFVTVAPSPTQVRSLHAGAESPSPLTDVIALGAGYTGRVFLRRDGTVHGYGYNQPVPAELSNMVALTGGPLGALALREDGTVIGWGESGFGISTIPPGLTEVVSVAQGHSFSLALRADGSIEDWPSASLGVPPFLDDIVEIAAGVDHALALRRNGTVLAWGTQPHAWLAVPAGLADVVAIACGERHSLALRSDGTVVAWGDPATGATGVPSGLLNVVGIAAGFDASYALHADGSVTHWGMESSPPAGLDHVIAIADHGQIALRDARVDVLQILTHPAPQVSSETQKARFAVEVHGGGSLSYQWRKDGTPIPGATGAELVLSGLTFGAEGNYDVVITNYIGSITSSSAHLTVNPSPHVSLAGPSRRVVASGTPMLIASEATGTGPLSYQWLRDGRPIEGATGRTLEIAEATLLDRGYYQVLVTDSYGTRRSRTTFVAVTAPHANTRLRQWPAPSTEHIFYRPFDDQWTDLVTFDGGRQLSSLGVRANGSVVGWGIDGFGSTFPPADLPPAVDVVVTERSGYALLADGTIRSWGSTRLDPPDLADVVSFAATDSHFIALRSDGTVVTPPMSTGANFDPPEPLTDIVAVALGGGHALALRADGTVMAWGRNELGQCDVPVGLHDVVAISAAGDSSLALKADGTVVGWGYTFTTFSHLNTIPAGLTDVIAIAQGLRTIALKSDYTAVIWGRPDVNYGQPELWQDVVQIDAGLHEFSLSSAPLITRQPTSQIATAGESLALGIQVAGSTSPSFQWYKDGVPLAGSTSAALVIPHVSATDAGRYHVVVSNSIGTTASRAAEVSVAHRPAPGMRLSGHRVVGGTLTIDVSVTDADGDYAFANLWIRAPGGAWHAIRADRTLVPSTALDPANSLGEEGSHRFRYLAGTEGTYEFRLQAIDAAGRLSFLVAQTIRIDATAAAPSPARDFNGDGYADLLWRNRATGEVAVWFMDGPFFAGSVSIGQVSLEWQNAGTGDFNRDGHTDLLWRNQVTGQVAVWFMAGASFAGSASLGVVSLEWEHGGTGDFDHDGNTDLLWRSRSTGEVAVWYLDGALFAGSASLGVVSRSWASAGTGDFNHDGHTDLLWRNLVTGQVAVWFMEGSSFAGSASLGYVSLDWEAAGTGDYNADGHTDILWRNLSTGEVAVWFFDGVLFAGSASMGSVALAWEAINR